MVIAELITTPLINFEQVILNTPVPAYLDFYQVLMDGLSSWQEAL